MSTTIGVGRPIRDAVAAAQFHVNFDGDPLASGHGSVAVWSGFDAFDAPIVAKVMPNSYGAAYEASMLSRLPAEDPRVATARLIAAGPVNTCFIFDDAGRPVSRELRKACKQNPLVAVDLIMNALRGVRTSHAAGVIHRDLHTGNFLVKDNDPSKVTVIDYGHSVAFENGQGTARAFSHAYTAPEMRLHPGEEVTLTPASDTYVLGLALAELVGHFPFPKPENPRDPAFEAELRAPPNLSAIPDAGLQRVLRKALAFESSQRFQSAQDFLDALRPIRQRLAQNG